MRNVPTFVVLAAALLPFGIAGCGHDDQPSSAPASAFPLTVTRRGGFAGVDDRVAIAADGSAVVTRRGQSPVQTSLPATAMTDLRRLLTTPEFAGRATPSDAPAECSDSYEYEFVSPSATTIVHDCNLPPAATPTQALAIVADLLNG